MAPVHPAGFEPKLATASSTLGAAGGRSNRSSVGRAGARRPLHIKGKGHHAHVAHHAPPLRKERRSYRSAASSNPRNWLTSSASRRSACCSRCSSAMSASAASRSFCQGGAYSRRRVSTAELRTCPHQGVLRTDDQWSAKARWPYSAPASVRAASISERTRSSSSVTLRSRL